MNLFIYQQDSDENEKDKIKIELAKGKTSMSLRSTCAQLHLVRWCRALQGGSLRLHHRRCGILYLQLVCVSKGCLLQGGFLLHLRLPCVVAWTDSALYNSLGERVEGQEE